jgi:MFS family permease
VTKYQQRFITEDNAKWWTLAAMCFALFMIMLDNTVVNVALPSIQREFDASIAELEWTVNAYTLSFAVLLATGGRLGDIFGRRRAFLFGVAVFALSSATAGLATSEAMLVASRIAQGVGAAFMMPATLSIITNAFPASERGRAIGTWAGVSALALAIGPLLGGFLTEHVSWRAIFYINLPVAAGAIVASLFAVRESRDESVGREIDYAGVALLTAGLTALVLALVEGNTWGWGSPGILALFGGAAVLPRRPSPSSCGCARPWSSSSSSAAATSSAPARSLSSSRSRCSGCSSSSRCTCRTSWATRPSRPASASCPRLSWWSSSPPSRGAWSTGSAPGR